MKNFKYILFAGIGMLVSTAHAQVSDGSGGYYDEALLLSQSNAITGSTARMQGLAGSQVSLGADMSSAGSNPAGLGMFNRSVVSFTPSMNFNTSDATYNSSMLSNYKNNFNFANLGIVFNSGANFKDEKFKGGSFAITLQRTNGFNQTFSYAGRNNFNSITDSFVEEANEYGVDANNPIYASDYAYKQFLIEQADGFFVENYGDGTYNIYPTGDQNGYTSLVGSQSNPLFTPYQTELVERQGDNYALNFSWGGNYNDVLYFGAGLAYRTVDYRVNKRFEETSFQNSSGDVDDLVQKIRFDQTEKIFGNGVDFTGGLIVRPVSFVTLGLSYSSPTFYSLEREYEYRLRSDLGSNYYYFDESTIGSDSLYYQLGSFDSHSEDQVPPLFTDSYNLKTTSKLTLGSTVFVGKHGFISGDVEIVDYQAMRVKSSDVIADGNDNSAIGSLYNSVVNYRIGAEYRLESFRIRSGYAFYADPYRSNSIDITQQAVTFGVGYRSQDFFIDFALVNQKSSEIYSPYSVSSNQPEISINNKNVTLSTSIGFNF